MPETHIPKLDRDVSKPDPAAKGARGKSVLHIALEVNYGDAVFVEPKLIGEYDELLRHIDRVLGD